MERIDFRTAFFGGRNRGFDFGADDRREKWMKMTNEEKIEFMDKKMEAMGDSISDRGGFGFGGDDRREKWMKMTNEEKIEFMDKKMEAMGDGISERGDFRGRGREFSIEAFDSLCEKWMKMSLEEKETYIKEREELIKSRMSGMDNPFGGRGPGFGFSFGR